MSFRESTPDRRDFFVSYNRADRQWAEWIAWQLEEANFTTVLQAWDFRPGCNFVEEMDRATRQAERTIAVLSPDYLTSKFTRPEWQAAFSKDSTGGDQRLVPVRVADCDVDGLLGQVVYIDFVGLAESDCRRELVDAVKLGRVKPDRPPGFPGQHVRTIASRPQFPAGHAAPHTPLFTVPFPEDPDFVGRDDDLNRLHAALAQDTQVGIRPAGLTGMGGIGKTALAARYAYQHRGDYPGGVIWINAAQSLLDEFGRLACLMQPALAGRPLSEQVAAAFTELQTRGADELKGDGVLSRSCIAGIKTGRRYLAVALRKRSAGIGRFRCTSTSPA